MAETTEQYRNRINQLNNNIKNEPGIVNMRGDIAEGISKTGNRQADIEVRQDTLEDDFVAVQQDASSASPSGAEVAVARGSYSTLDQRLTEEEQKVTAQFAQNENEIKQASTPYNYKGALVTFIDDDNKDTFMDLWKPVCDAKGIRITLALITNWVGGSGRLTLTQLKALQADGYDFANHSFSHDATIFNSGAQDLGTVSDSRIEEEYRKSQEWMRSNGLQGYNTFIYPWGNFNELQELRYKRLARKYFKQGVNASGIYNESPNDNMYLNRKFINKNKSISEYKQDIDNAITNNGWLIFGTHSVSEEINVEYLTEIAEYIQSKNIPILTFNEALKYKGNALSIGEKKDKDKLYVGNDGSVELDFEKSMFVNQPYNRDASMDNPISDYPIGLTSKPIRTINDYLTGEGGLLKTYRAFNEDGSPNDSFSYQTFKPLFTSNVVYRYWDLTNGIWGSWVGQPKTGTITFNSKWAKAAGRRNTLRQEGGLVVGNLSFQRTPIGNITNGEEIGKISGVSLPATYSHFFASVCFRSAPNNPTMHSFAVTPTGSIIAQGGYDGIDIDKIYINFSYTI